MRAANSARLPVVVVANQSGIALGFFLTGPSSPGYEMHRQLSDAGAQIDALGACPFHLDFADPKRRVAMNGATFGCHIAQMTCMLGRRGPDDEGVWLDEGVGIALGHRYERLPAAKNAERVACIAVIARHHWGRDLVGQGT